MPMNHIVLLSFKDPSQAEPLFAALGRLQTILPGMLSYSHGPYSSSEGANAGYTHGFLMTFTGATARDAYLAHPEHEKVKSDFLPYVSQFVAFDFES